MPRYVKCRFYSERGATAGLIFQLDASGRVVNRAGTVMTLAELSRRYPMYEAPKMVHYEVSDPYASWHEAFAHQFPERS